MTKTTAERAIVVGVDTSQVCLDAARWAAYEAVRCGVKIRLVHACIFPPADLAHQGSSAGEDEELLLEHGNQWLKRAAIVARYAAPGVRFETEVRFGLAPELLLAESAEARLIVVGSHGLGGLRGVLIGSVALKVAAQASCPVVVVRGSEPQLHGPVVVGVDASSESEQAVGFALEAAAAREVPLVVAHAWHDEVAAAGTNLAELKAGERRRALNDRMAGWCEKYPGVEVRLCAVRDRNAARALLRLSVNTQLIVVGSRGRGPVAGGLLGSTGNSLLLRATCPVVVVHER